MREHRPRRDRDPPDEPRAPEPPGVAGAPEERPRRPEPAAEEMGGESACQMHRFFDLEAED